RRMRIRQQALAEVGLAIVAPPDLGPAEIEALVAGKAVDHRGLLAAQRGDISVVGKGEAGEVGDILAHGELALDVRSRERLISVILRAELAGERLEVRHILRRPPVAEPALAVIFRALIVEMVAELMADHRADA